MVRLSYLLLLAACGDNLIVDDTPPQGRCGDGIVQPELGEDCDGIAEATCSSGVGRPVCAATCRLDRASCGPAVDTVEISAHAKTSCARTSDGAIRCWGYNQYQNAMPPPRSTRQWALGNIDGVFEVVRLGEDGRVHVGPRKLPTFQADEIAAIVPPTTQGTCALRRDGTIVCALRKAGEAPNARVDVSTPDPQGRYQQLFGTAETLCGVSTNSTLTCWQYDTSTFAFSIAGADHVAVAGPLADLDVVDSTLGRAIVYVTAADNAIHVLGSLPPELAPPEGTWRNLSFSTVGGYGCGATADGTARCWGAASALPSPLDVRTDLGSVHAVEVLTKAACSLGATGALRCWGGGSALNKPPADRDDVVDVQRVPSTFRDSLAFRTTTGVIHHAFVGFGPPPTSLLFEDGEVLGLVGEDSLANQCITRAASPQICWGRSRLRAYANPVDVFARLRFCGRVDAGIHCSVGIASVETFADADTGWQSLVATDSWVSPLCGRRADGTYTCALDADPYTAEELGSYEHARAATEYFCGQSASAIECTPATWLNLVPPRIPFSIPGHYRDFRPLSLGDTVADIPIITLSEAGEVACHRPTSAVDPDCAGFDVAGRTFRSIGATCGVTDTGAVHCFHGAPSPHDLYGATDVAAPLTLFNSVGGGLFCAGYADGLYRCGSAGRVPPIAGSLLDVQPGGYLTCGRTPDRVLHCWSTYATTNPEVVSWLAQIPTDLVAESYSVGVDTICARSADGALACWSAVQGAAAPPADRQYVDVSVGILHGCAIDTDGRAACWKLSASAGDLELPSGPVYRSVTAGADFACGLATGGAVHCAFAANRAASGDLQLAPRHTDFTQIAAGVDHVCGLRAGGFIGCFGANLQGQASPPLDGGYVDVTSGEQYSCAAKPGAPVRCWGAMRYE